MTPHTLREADLIAHTAAPRTVASLTHDLTALGLSPGDVCVVHSSLRRIGWVNGGAVAVIQALQSVLTSEGTLVMPTHTSALSDPAEWGNPPVPPDWWTTIRDTMPGYDPQRTPTHYMGCIPELFRTWPGVLRSAHPRASMAAWGRHAARIVEGHELDDSMGERSPLARLYELDAFVLLLGVDFFSNTSFHLAEYRAGTTPRRVDRAPVYQDGATVWKEYEDIEMDAERFGEIGAAFVAAGHCGQGLIGSAEGFLFRQRVAVDFATAWLREQRDR